MGVSVRHNARLAAALGVAAAVVTVAWFSRALLTGSVTDWLVCFAVAAVGVVQLVVVRDSRAPLMLADEHGIRVRRNETWSGLRWQDIDHVEVQAAGAGLRAWFREGRIVLHGRSVADAGSPAATRSYVVPLGVTTRVDLGELSGDLVAGLETLASGRSPVRVAVGVPVFGQPATPTPEHVDPAGPLVPRQSTALDHEGTAAPERQAAPMEEFEPVEPGREALPASRAEVSRERAPMPHQPAVPAQRTEVTVTASVGEHPPAARARGASGAVIGPLVAAARHRARLSIDTLSERTRIRPHVLESIEVDDFGPCGGDFYARGHLRTLARVFGLDPEELVGLYDDRYAQAEIEARQVFEAELATGIGGGVSATSSGPRWSLLAACVLALALVWGSAKIFGDTPQELVSPAPGVADTAGLAQGQPTAEPKTTLAPLRVIATGASPQVVVRDRDGRILWAGRLARGREQQVIGLAPFEVTASNGKAVRVTLLGKPRGTVGPTSAAESKQFG